MTSPTRAGGGAAPLWWCLTTCVLYGAGSGGLALANKALVAARGRGGWEFRWSQTLLLLQMVSCVLLMRVFQALGLVRLSRGPPALGGRLLPLLSRLTPLSLCYVLNASCGMLSLQGLSLPMYSVLKRLTPLLVALLEWTLHDKRTSPRVSVALGTCAAGFVLAGAGDLVFDARAYALALASCASQAMYLLSVERVGRENGLESHELLYYNSMLSALFLAPLVLLSGEVREAAQYAHWLDGGFLLCLTLLLLLGMSLNYTQFLCTQVNSPLTTCMVGVAKGVLTTLAGFFAFGGQPITALNLTGVSLNTAGGAMYAWAKFVEKEASKATKHSHSHSAHVTPVKQANGHAHAQVEPLELEEKQQLLHSTSHPRDKLHGHAHLPVGSPIASKA